jgi:hypothetical protein
MTAMALKSTYAALGERSANEDQPAFGLDHCYLM